MFCIGVFFCAVLGRGTKSTKTPSTIAQFVVFDTQMFSSHYCNTTIQIDIDSMLDVLRLE